MPVPANRGQGSLAGMPAYPTRKTREVGVGGWTRRWRWSLRAGGVAEEPHMRSSRRQSCKHTQRRALVRPCAMRDAGVLGSGRWRLATARELVTRETSVWDLAAGTWPADGAVARWCRLPGFGHRRWAERRTHDTSHGVATLQVA